MTPLIVGAAVLAVFVVGWFLFYRIAMASASGDADGGGAFKLIMIIVTPVFIFCAVILAFYITIGGFIIEWVQSHGGLQ